VTDKNAWVHLIQYLSEDNASSLSGQDLVTASQKSEIHVTIEKALTRLKGSFFSPWLLWSPFLLLVVILVPGSDKRLPQILRMRDLLGRGIGVHHGGLLPIVKGQPHIDCISVSLFPDESRP
jgi:antiviral helicase SKI2